MGTLEGTKVMPGHFLAYDQTVEPANELAERMLQWWNKTITALANEADAKDEAVVLVLSHGASISTMVSALIQFEYVIWPESVGRIRVFNTSITEIFMPGDGKAGTLKRYADMMHMLTPVVQTNVDVIE